MKTNRILITICTILTVFAVAPVGLVKGEISFKYPPEARFTISPTSGYAPLFVEITDQSRFADDIKWIIYDAVDPEGQPWWESGTHNRFYIYTFPGTYPVVLEATNEVGTDTCVKYVTVLESGLPAISVEFVGAPQAGPVGTTVNFINTTVGTFDKYLWDFGDGTSDTNEDTSHTYNTAGLYTVSLTLMSTLGTGTETKVNYINIYPASSSMLNPDFVATPVTGTPPHMVQFSNLTGGEAGDVLWDFGDGTESAEINPKHVYDLPGVYTVTLSIDGEKVSKDKYIKVFSQVADERCPAAVVLNNDESQLAILQSFRDNVLSQTLPGLALIELYNTHSLEIVSILLANEDIKEEAGAVLGELLPGFQSVNEGGTMTITPVQFNKIKAIIGRIASQASPELGGVLGRLIMELNGGQFFKSIGINVTAE